MVSCPNCLLISGSKVRVLDGPPMSTGASGAPEAPADFHSVVRSPMTRKSKESHLRIKQRGKAICPRVAPIAAWFAADAATPLSRSRGPAQSSVPTSGGRSRSDAEKRERGLGENGLSDLQRR